ncbi:MAG: histidinol-phosphatase [Bacteroidetes bacterium]|nr:histidinol-phosphatase [Bacteroidota bacterium]MDA1120051.1 histidinol-phosphatase [Bacteroidota bacterium]
MNFSKTWILLSIIVATISCNKKEPVSTQWFKGNLHTHSYWSDGDEFPEVIMDWYKAHGYQFVALSDHNILARGEKWIVVPEDSIYQNAFRKYLDNYGADWVNHRQTSGGIQVKLKTLDEYRGRYEEKDRFLIIESEEITDRFEGKPLHMNATNIQTKIDPQGGNSVSEVLQNNLNEVIKQREVTGTPMIPHINHPNFGYGVSLDDMMALRGERFFEVYNGHPAVHNQGDTIHISTEKMWDLLNISYLKNNQPLIYGLGTDDSHHYHVKGGKWSNAGRGWIMVQSDSLTAASLIAAMEAGQFYASSGVTLKSLEFDNNKLTVEVAPEAGVTYTISFIGARKGKSEPEQFSMTEGNKADFELTEDILFVRSKITSSKLHNNPIENLLYEMAWTQPVQSDF